MTENLTAIFYLISAIFFILALKGLSHPESARNGNTMGIIAMIIAIITTLFNPNVSSYTLIILGIVIGGSLGTYIALKIEMTALPQLVAAFHSLVGLAAVFVAASAFNSPESYGIVDVNGNIFKSSLVEMSLGVAIGAITFTGSIIAFLKLQGLVSGAPTTFFAQHFINLLILISLIVLTIIFTLEGSANTFWIIVSLSLLLGVLLIIPIGGADMPVVVSMLNSYSGWAASVTGFMLSNDLLIVVGALVGSSGAILSYIMCRAMNRSFISVIAGGFGTESSVSSAKAEDQGEIEAIDIEEFKEMINSSKKIAIIPGYGMAVAQAQFVVNEMISILKTKDISTIFVIHPVAGRMPGHMNVLLAEAQIPYDIVYEMDEVNDDFESVDLSIVIGANDIVNPSALEDPNSPIAGMPVIECWRGTNTVVLKRGMSTGYAGVENPLFFKGNTKMLFGDAKESLLKVL